MSVRLRSLAVLLGLLAALLAPPAVDLATSSGRSEPVVAATAPSLLRVASAARTAPLRAAAPVPLLAAVVVLLLLLVVLGVVGPARRRIGDDGDRWRALLLGAPPARA